MRPIKFRAWYNGKMYHVEHLMFLTYGDDEFNATLVEDIFIDGIRLPQENIETHGSQIIIEEFTGLLDGHGKEIYEGDIIQYSDQYDHCSGRGIVFMGWGDDGESGEHYGWCIKYDKPNYGNDTGTLYKGYQSGFEENSIPYYYVIGNIHENPETLC